MLTMKETVVQNIVCRADALEVPQDLIRRLHSNKSAGSEGLQEGEEVRFGPALIRGAPP
jgi:hypothetical protein